MSRRTLVVVARGGGRYDCRLAQWGVDADPVAQSRPLGTGLTEAEVRSEIDATRERVVAVDLLDGGPTAQYCVCWLDPMLADPDDVALAAAADLDALRGWWTECKSHASAVLARGEADPTAVRTGLLAALRRRADRVWLPDDAPFFSGHR